MLGIIRGALKHVAGLAVLLCILIGAVVIHERIEKARFEKDGHGGSLSGVYLSEEDELCFDEKGYFWGSYGSGTYYYAEETGALNLHEKGGLLLFGKVSEDRRVITGERTLEGTFVLEEQKSRE